MSVISGIVPTSRKHGRFDILIGGRPYVSLSLNAIVRLKLTVGSTIAGLEGRIAAEVVERRIHDRALRMLAFRARSASELTRALVRKGEEQALVDRVIAMLREQGLLDDAAFAQSFARAKIVGGRTSRRRVQQDLAARGVERNVVDAALDRVLEDEGIDQQEMVEQVARKKMRSLAQHEPDVRTRRLYAFLARRGYESAQIRRAMQIVGRELGEQLAEE